MVIITKIVPDNRYHYQAKPTVFIAGWFQAARTLESIGLIGAVVSCIYALATNCCRAVPGPRSRFLEVVAGITGMSFSNSLVAGCVCACVRLCV